MGLLSYQVALTMRFASKDDMPLRRHTIAASFLLFPILLFWPAAGVYAQQPPILAFRADHYDVTASLDPVSASLSATARVDFASLEGSSLVLVELNRNLQITSVKAADGKVLPFERDRQNPLLVQVTLPAPAAPGSRVTLTFVYGGVLVNEENSPVPGMRVASINRDAAYLLLPARWFPLTNYPSNRYTATFRLEVPDSFVVAGTGKAAPPNTLPADRPRPGATNRLQYVFQCDNPAPVGTFVAGNLQFSPQQAEGISVGVYAPPAATKIAGAFAGHIAHIVTTLADLFGPLPDPDLTLIQLPDGTLRSFAAPGVLLLSQRAWDARASERELSRLVASQWWGSSVLPATPADVWISDGLARYSETLFQEQLAGREAGLRAVDDFAVGALMYEDAAPVAQAQRLAPYSSDYRSVVMNKGAIIFHMLRAQMGDAPFHSLLRDFYAKYAGKSARIEEFENMAIAKMESTPVVSGPPPPPGAAPPPPKPNLRTFFAQWLNSTGVPEFKLEYVEYRTPKGFKVVGKLTQPLETFSMPVEIRIDTEGNPETKIIQVIGTQSDFVVDTFGRPKPGGIKIDPNNLILKASTSLRARAGIARGEDLAEIGRYYDAIMEYQHALSIQPNRSLANFRMGEAFFYQKNYQASANAFREALQSVPEPSEKWTEVWSHIYLGKIFDATGQRERAVNEYSKAKQTNDNTGGAQEEAERLLKKAYSDALVAPVATPAAPVSPPAKPVSVPSAPPKP